MNKLNLKLKHLKNRIFKPFTVGIHCHCAENKEKLLELLEKAKSEGVKYLDINNYKSLKIYSKVLPQLSKEELEPYKDISLIPSIEMPGVFEFTDVDGNTYNIETHILGYGVDLSKEELLDKFVESKYKSLNQEEELQRLIKIGHEIGLEFNDEDVYLDPNDDNRKFAGRAFTQALMKNMDANFCKEGENNKNKLPYELRTNWRAFQNRCVKDKNNPFYLDLAAMNPPVEEVLDLIHQMGGKAYLAHPSSYFAKVGSTEDVQQAFRNTVKLVKDFATDYPYKLDGVEVYHPSYLENYDVVSEIGEMCKKYRLATSGGTDIHVDKTLGKDETVSSDSMGKGGKVNTRALRKFKHLRRKAVPVQKLRQKVIEMNEKDEER